MSNVIQPFHLLVIALAGWLNRQQQTAYGAKMRTCRMKLLTDNIVVNVLEQ